VIARYYYSGLLVLSVDLNSWEDVIFGDEGVKVIIRRSKTDQEGRGAGNWNSYR